MFFGNLRMMVACLIICRKFFQNQLSPNWKNLADAIDIMLGDIAESTGSTLKWTAESLTTLAQNWKEVVPFITAATAALEHIGLRFMQDHVPWEWQMLH